MALKTILETLEGVDDALQSFYVENDGKYVLQVEGVDEHPDVANLRNAYQRTKATANRQRRNSKRFRSSLQRCSRIGQTKPSLSQCGRNWKARHKLRPHARQNLKRA